MGLTDCIIFILNIFLVTRGASRGFMRSLLGPFSIIVATIISIIYYQITKDIILSLVIGLLGPIFLHFFLKGLLKAYAKATNTEIRPDFLSSLGGVILTLIWGWVFIIFTLLLLALLPPWNKPLAAIHNDVLDSGSYHLIKPLGDSFFAPSKQNVTAVTSPSAVNDAKSLADDPRFKKVLQDPEIQKEINDHDMIHLMSNPKMIALTQQIMSDPATFKKIMAIYNSQTQSQAPSKPSAFSELQKDFDAPH